MKKLVLLFFATMPFLSNGMDIDKKSSDKIQISDKNYTRFINKVRKSEPLLFTFVNKNYLPHALYIACLENQILSVKRIVSYCNHHKISLVSLYGKMGLLLGNIYDNKIIIQLLAIANITEPMDINEALHLAVEKEDHPFLFDLTERKDLIDPKSLFARSAMELAVYKKSLWMILRLFRVGIPLDAARQKKFMIEHPRISQIRSHEKHRSTK